ncbi:hypothetical protein LMG26411_07943 [Cupriavidus numazuensis]|uniref:Uncharacterized protein n=1 Tax=Cupriavidus numazuensis TaxID=221992 RepID=A0ABM8TW80_9BURK|nr:hypothetical protein LMG26411_07943 [Cupriavidus numazuensis]
MRIAVAPPPEVPMVPLLPRLSITPSLLIGTPTAAKGDTTTASPPVTLITPFGAVTCRLLPEYNVQV